LRGGEEGKGRERGKWGNGGREWRIG